MKTPKTVKSIELEATCVGISLNEWGKYMNGATRANKNSIHRIVKRHLPELYEELSLNYYNPYNYLKSKTHLILIHSGIEYFIKYQ